MDETGVIAAHERPLWRKILDFPLVALVLAVVLYAAATVFSLALFDNDIFGGGLLPFLPTPWGLFVRSLITIVVLLATYKLLIARLGERPRDELQLAGAAKDLGLGIGAGFALFCIVVAVAALIDVYNIVGPGGLQQLPTTLIAAAIIPGITEEILFRGILFRWIEEFAGSWAALVVTSALFGLAHILNPNATWFSSFTIAVEAGVLLGGAYMLTRSLWMPIGLHAAWNFTQGFVFDVPVSGIDQQGMVEARLSGPELLSGGSFGLEASVIALIVATGAGLWFVVRAVRAGNVVRPWWARTAS